MQPLLTASGDSLVVNESSGNVLCLIPAGDAGMFYTLSPCPHSVSGHF